MTNVFAFMSHVYFSQLCLLPSFFIPPSPLPLPPAGESHHITLALPKVSSCSCHCSGVLYSTKTLRQDIASCN